MKKFKEIVKEYNIHFKDTDKDALFRYLHENYKNKRYINDSDLVMNYGLLSNTIKKYIVDNDIIIGVKESDFLAFRTTYSYDNGCIIGYFYKNKEKFKKFVKQLNKIIS